MRLGILYNRAHGEHLYASNTLAPLLRWRRAIRECGIELVFSSRINSSILSCETILLIDFFDSPAKARPEEIEALHDMRARGCRLVYFDNSDSCGTTQFDMLEHVDRYLKKQLYRDRSLYRRNIYSHRTYCAFYHDTFGIDDAGQPSRAPLARQQAGKLALGWNGGFGPYRLQSRLLRALNRRNFNAGLVCKRMFGAGGAPSRAANSVDWTKRPIDIHYRAYINFDLETISFARRTVNEMLGGMQNDYTICFNATVGRSRYLKEMSLSKAVISPFGYGEICRRDFEVFCSGGVLVKPDMSHVETWPDYYEKDATYLAYDWDFSNLKKILHRAARHADSADIAARAQNRYFSAINNDGQTKFCQRLINLVSF